MEKLSEMDIHKLDLKAGDVKVDSEELKRIFDILQSYHNILCFSFKDQLSQEQQEDLQQGLDFTEYLQNKYLVLGHLRETQKQYYDLLQQVNVVEGDPDQKDETRKEIWALYIDIKTQRETLQREVDRAKDRFYDSNNHRFLYEFH